MYDLRSRKLELYTPDEAASILKLSAYTVRRLLREGKLPGIKIGAGQLWRIRKDQLEAYLTAQSTGGREATQTGSR
jgi:excisionase family DNA binding protein